MTGLGSRTPAIKAAMRQVSLTRAFARDARQSAEISRSAGLKSLALLFDLQATDADQLAHDWQATIPPVVTT